MNIKKRRKSGCDIKRKVDKEENMKNEERRERGERREGKMEKGAMMKDQGKGKNKYTGDRYTSR